MAERAVTPEIGAQYKELARFWTEMAADVEYLEDVRGRVNRESDDS